MLAQQTFLGYVVDAYENLYNIAYLLTCPLTDLLVADLALSGSEKARHLHSLLLRTIDDLNPGPHAHVSSREWRRHRLMLLRYADGLDPRLIADQLAISVRHYYREHKEALEAIAMLLWDRYCEQQGQPEVQADATNPNDTLTRRELVLNEATRLYPRYSQTANLVAVMQGVVPLIEEMAQQKGIYVAINLEDALPDLEIDPNILRQILLELFSYTVGHLDPREVCIKTVRHQDYLSLLFDCRGPMRVQDAPASDDQPRISVLNGLATVSSIQYRVHQGEHGITGFELELPTTSPRTVLIVDDNEQVVRLVKSYLIKNNYRYAMAQTGSQAVQMAIDLQPHVIVLDVMIPEPDGWTVLQTLKNRLETRHIPVVICTVLSAKELALSLGANAFLEKPVTEVTLISTLTTVR